MAAVAPSTTSSATACKAESKDQVGLSCFLSFIREDLFHRSLRILPPTPNLPKVVHLVLYTNHGAGKWNHPRRLPQPEPPLPQGKNSSSLAPLTPAPEQSGQRGNACLINNQECQPILNLNQNNSPLRLFTYK